MYEQSTGGRGADLVADHLGAIGVVRMAKNLFAWLLVLCLLTQVVFYVAGRYGHVFDVALSAATQPAATQTSDVALSTSGTWLHVGEALVPLTRFVGVVLASLLAVTLLVAIKVSLSGGLGGAQGTTGAFFWSLLLMAIVWPWRHTLAGVGEVPAGFVANLPAALYEWSDLKGCLGHSLSASMMDRVFEWARFLGYPLLALLTLLAAQVRWTRGYRQMRSGLEDQQVAIDVR